MILEFSAVPYTSEYFLAGTGSLCALTTANYFPSVGLGRNMAATRAFLSLDPAANVRFKMNGSAPAANCGHIFAGGDYITLDDISQIKNFQFMPASASATAYLHVTYFEG